MMTRYLTLALCGAACCAAFALGRETAPPDEKFVTITDGPVAYEEPSQQQLISIGCEGNRIVFSSSGFGWRAYSRQLPWGKLVPNDVDLKTHEYDAVAFTQIHLAPNACEDNYDRRW